MKKVLLALSIALCLSHMHAQVTIDGTNLFQTGDRIISGGCVSVLDPNIVPGNPGPSQTWNFTTSTYEYYDTTDIFAPGWLAPSYTAQCPQTTHLMAYGANAVNFDLILADGSGFYIVGTAANDINFGVITTVYQDPVDWMHWPATFGQSYMDTAYSDNTIPVAGGSIDSSRTQFTMTFTSDVDAWGTVNINSGSYSAIRLKRVLSYYIMNVQHDTLLGWQTPSTYTLGQTMYEWWTDSPGIGFPIVTMYENQSGNIQQYNILHLSTTEVTDQNASNPDFNLYPSPASATLNVQTACENGTWQMSDMTGRVVMSGAIASTATQIDVSYLQAGVYTLTIVDTNGIRTTKKFSKE